MRILNNLTLAGSKNRPIVLDVFYKITKTPKPLLIFCHGFKGFKDWGHFNLIAEYLADNGFVVCKFNFSHNGGTAEEVIDFPDLEAFGNNNYSIERDDLACVIDAWQVADAFVSDAEVDRSHVALMGHSRGGGACILQASEDVRVKKLITLAGINSAARLFQDEAIMAQWKKDGVYYIQNGRTKQQMPLYYQLYEDWQANAARLDVGAAASSLQNPWLIVHGDDDAAVDVSAAKELFELSKHGELMIVEGANHVFGGKHPWTEQQLPKDMELVLEKVVAFLG